MILMDSVATSDERLCQLARKGDREAFGRIVERYQSLICSLAFSACGSLAASEDLAQETFITAWSHLNDLREPGKLRQWLCGIVRNLAANAVRRELRRGGAPESLEAVVAELAPEKDPAAQVVTREEEELLWRALAGIPENYREPMVLFYREHQSVAEVASGLDLSEDVVKQRLSRGRAILREEMAVLVESTLTRSRPASAFTGGVLAALPFISKPGATAATAAGGLLGKAAGAAGKSILGSVGWGVLAGPIVGLFIAMFSSKAAALTARSRNERQCILRHARGIVLFCFAMSIGLAAVLSQAGKLYPVSPGWIILGVFAWVALLVLTILAWTKRMEREVDRIRAQTGTDDAAYADKLIAHGLNLEAPRTYQSRLRFLGLPLVAFAYGGYDADTHRARTVCGWIAVGDRALSPLFALGGLAIAPIAVGGVTVGIFSVSLWGIGIGALALGSIALGWSAIGFAAVGWKSAIGVVALARDYAIGPFVRAAEANTQAAKDWFHSQWSMDILNFFVHQAHWLILLCVVVVVGLRLRRAWQLRRLSCSGSPAATFKKIR